MAEIEKNLWKEYDGKGFSAEHSVYAERANRAEYDITGNDLTLTVENSRVTQIGGKTISAVSQLPDPTVDNSVLAGDSTGAKEWKALTKDTFGSINDDEGDDIQDEEGNSIGDENSVELWASFNGTGFGAERAVADADGNNIAETYAKKGEASSVTTSYDALTKTLTINI